MLAPDPYRCQEPDVASELLLAGMVEPASWERPVDAAAAVDAPERPPARRSPYRPRSVSTGREPKRDRVPAVARPSSFLELGSAPSPPSGHAAAGTGPSADRRARPGSGPCAPAPPRRLPGDDPSPFPLTGFAVRGADFLAGSTAFPQGSLWRERPPFKGRVKVSFCVSPFTPPRCRTSGQKRGVAPSTNTPLVRRAGRGGDTRGAAPPRLSQRMRAIRSNPRPIRLSR